MKKSEIITKHYGAIKAEMTKHYRTVLESGGNIQYGIYIWEDGTIEALEQIQGDNSYLQARNGETLCYVCTIDAPCFDPWDFTDHSAPEDETERETERAEIIDWLVSNYDEEASAKIDAAIDAAKYDEEYAL